MLRRCETTRVVEWIWRVLTQWLCVLYKGKSGVGSLTVIRIVKDQGGRVAWGGIVMVGRERIILGVLLVEMFDLFAATLVITLLRAKSVFQSMEGAVGEEYLRSGQYDGRYPPRTSRALTLVVPMAIWASESWRTRFKSWRR